MSTPSLVLDALTPYLVGWCAILGLLIGSFVNVVAYRVPAGLSTVRPRSKCPGCDGFIRSRDNIPVVSWVFLGGKCRDCKISIAVRYPLVEAATGVLFAGLAWRFGFTLILPLVLWAAAAGVALFLIDLDTMRLPDKVSANVWGVAAVGTVVAGFSAPDGQWGTVLVRTGLSALVWGVVFFVPWFATAGRGMGFGDVKLAPALGAILGWLGWGASLVGLMSGFVFGAVIGVALIVFGKAGRKSRVPYGPFLLTGALVGLVAGERIFAGYLALFGF